MKRRGKDSYKYQKDIFNTIKLIDEREGNSV